MIDALIRKSQAEFGPDKDVYAKRFQKAIINKADQFLFQQLFIEYAYNVSTSREISNIEWRQGKMQKDNFSLATWKNIRRVFAG